MTDEQATEGQFQIQRIYCKDISFEAPDTPQIFIKEWKPELDLQVNLQTNNVADNTYEVVLGLTVTVKNNNKTAFLVELQQAGVFQIQGISEKQLQIVTNIDCANMLFPFAREAVADLVNRGSFPQLLLAPVNFEMLYRQHLQQKQTGQGETIQ